MSKQIQIEFLYNNDDILNIGKIDSSKDQYGKTYKFIKRRALPIKTLQYNSIAIKIYHMLRDSEDLPINLVESLDSFIKMEIENSTLKLDQKIGFAILSQGFLSINMWGRGNVLFTQTYTIEKNSYTLSREPLEKTGVACTWESKIMSFEYNLWHEYLKSCMAVKDKQIYLTNFISGELDD